MIVLVLAIEVGSVRAVTPVCIELIKNGDKLLIDDRGYFKKDPIEVLDSSLIKLPSDIDGIRKFILQKSIDVVLFSVNVHDIQPLKVARIAQSLKIKTVHLLDYWNGYRSRMELDGQEVFTPSRYLVPDEYAKKQAIKEGISKKTIGIVGQPAFSDAEVNFKEKKTAQ